MESMEEMEKFFDTFRGTDVDSYMDEKLDKFEKDGLTQQEMISKMMTIPDFQNATELMDKDIEVDYLLERKFKDEMAVRECELEEEDANEDEIRYMMNKMKK